MPEKKAISGFGLFDICEDTLGQLWAHNQKYLLRINTKEAVAFAGAGKRAINGDIINLFTTYNGHLWVATSEQLYELDPLQQVFKKHYLIVKNDTLKPDDFLACAFKQGWMARTKQGGVFYYDARSGVARMLLQIQPWPLLYAKCRKGSYKNVLVTSASTIYDIDSNGRIQKTPLSDTAGAIDELANLDRGSYLTYHLGGKLYKTQKNSGNQKLISQGLKDVQRVMAPVKLHGNWITAMNDPNGIWLHNNLTDELMQWVSGTNQASEKLQGWTMGMLQDKTGGFWILNNESILHLAATTAHHAATSFWPHKDEFVKAYNPNLAYSNLVAADAHHPYLINTYYNELRVYDTLSGKLIQKMAIPDSGVNRLFYCLLQADEWRWLIGYRAGYLVYDMRANKLLPSGLTDSRNPVFEMVETPDSIFCRSRLGIGTIHRQKLGQFNFQPKESKLGLETDGDGNIWLLTMKGLYRKKRAGNWVAIDTLLGKTMHLGGAMFFYNRYSARLMIVIADKLLELDKTTGAIIRTTVMNQPELPAEFRYVIPLSASELWLGSEGSPAIVYNIETGNSYPIGAIDGWWAENLGYSSHVADDNRGNYWVSLDAGFMHVNAAYFRRPATPLQAPVISELLLQHRPWPIHPAAYSELPLEISYKMGHIALKMEAGNSDSIEYKLEPYDQEWHKGNIATYTNLNGGNYVFKSRVVAANGLFSDQASMQLNVIPPVWKQWWFRILVALVLSLLITWTLRRRIKRQQKEFEVKLQLAQSELKAIRSQMNPHFIFNCMTAIDGLIAGDKKQLASQYLSKFSRLLRRVLTQSEQQLVPLTDDLETLKIYLQLEELRMNHQLEWTLEIDEQISDGVMVPPLLMQPFVENAIIHGLKPMSSGKYVLIIKAVMAQDSILLSVYDNGVGRMLQNKPAHQSMGTQLTISRLSLLENVTGMKTQVEYNDLKNADGAALGTEVIITLKPNQNG